MLIIFFLSLYLFIIKEKKKNGERKMEKNEKITNNGYIQKFKQWKGIFFFKEENSNEKKKKKKKIRTESFLDDLLIEFFYQKIFEGKLISKILFGVRKKRKLVWFVYLFIVCVYLLVFAVF